MNQRSSIIGAAVLVTALSANAASAGAWLQPRGSHYAKVYGSYLYATREFNASGEKVDILSSQRDVTRTAFRDVTIGTYVEYGVSERLTVVGKLPFKILTSRRTEITDLADLRYDVEAVNGGLADLEVAGRVPIVTTPLPVSLQLGVKLPLGYRSRPSNGGAALGSGSPDLEARLQGGLSLHPYGYVGAEFGYRVRGGDVDDEMDILLEAGTRRGRVRVGAKLDVSFSTGSIEQLAESSTKGVTNYESVQVLPTISVLLAPHIALSVEAIHTLSGKNTTVGTSWAVGVELTR